MLNINSQPLEDALNEFARQASVQVLYKSLMVEAKTAPRVVGELTARQGLERLLDNSGLRFEFINERTVAIRLEPSAAATQDSTMRLAQGQAMSSPAAQATQNEGGASTKLDEIVVTAQKREESIQDVPVPVTVVNPRTLVENSQLRVQDYYNRIPGLSLVAAGNGGEPIIAIRGITTGVATNPTVGIVIDEISYGMSVITSADAASIPDVDPGDLARVEVLRGPQGTLYGAASMGGLLKFVTMEPSFDRIGGDIQLGSSMVSRSSDTGYSARGAINIPLTPELSIRASGFKVRDPGYIDNIETGQRDVNERDASGARLAVKWRASDAFTLKLGAVFQETKRLGTDDVDVTLGQNLEQGFLKGSGIYNRKVQAYGATAIASLGAVELTSATGYSVDESANNVDLTTFGNGLFIPFALANFGVDRMATVTDREVKKFTQELRASIPLGDRVTWLLGGFYTEEDTFRYVDNSAANASSGAVVGSLFKTTLDGRFSERAAFSNLTIELSDRWDVQAGGRISQYRQSYPSVLSGPVIFAFYARDPVISPARLAEDRAVTYLLTPRFKISEEIMAYARLASGYRPGGPNLSCGIFAGVPCEFTPDKTENYDLGIKGNLLGRMLSFDASIYHIDWTDIQIAGVRFTIPNGGFTTYTGNVSRARSRGVELSLESRPLAGLTFAGWVAYDDAELTADFPLGSSFGREGDRLPFSSRLSYNLSTDFERALQGALVGTLGVSFSHVGDRAGNFQATAGRQIYPAYDRLDVRAGVKYEDWSLSLFVNNATDERGILRGGLDSTLYPSYFTYIQPRTVGITVGKVF